jgi:hypothetical protein
VRCGRCGNENSEGNRFCGMCGAPLVPKAQAHVPVTPSTGRCQDPVRAPEEIRIPARAASDGVPEAAPPSVSRTVITSPAPISGSAAPSVTPPVVAPVVSPTPPARADSGPAVYGPSFLGLNRPPDGRNGMEPGSGHHSGNLDYLLEDEEEPKRGWGKLLVVVIALGLIGGFGYLRWKQGGFSFLKLGGGTQSAQSATDSVGSPSASTSTPPAPSVDSSNGASQNSGAGNPANAGTAATPSTTDSGANGSAQAPGSNSSPGTDAGAQPTASSAMPPAAGAAPDNSSAGKPEGGAAAEKSSEVDSAEDAEAGPAKAESHAAPSPATPASARPAATKPSAARTREQERKPTPVTPMDTTAEAERYIYGRGVPQDCDVGLRMLKPAAQTNPKAMITLGTLYSSGTCTPRDLPTAYRWFAMALHKQPDNQTLQDDLQQLWSQMTPPERQLAIKLSQ